MVNIERDPTLHSSLPVRIYMPMPGMTPLGFRLSRGPGERKKGSARVSRLKMLRFVEGLDTSITDQDAVPLGARHCLTRMWP